MISQISQPSKSKEKQKKKTALSFVQPSGVLTIANYLGALRNWVLLQEDHDCFFGIADLHALTNAMKDSFKSSVLRENTERMIFDLLAIGVDPNKCQLFIQSLVPEHTELAWILNCFSSHGELSRQTQFKDKSKGKEKFISTGLFTYPILQASDILLYKSEVIPIGLDQKQHLELTRNIADRFNNKFETKFFPVPEPLFTSSPKIMSLADPTKKMGKSLGEKHWIGLFEDSESIRIKVKKSVTDSGNLKEGEISPGLENLFQLLEGSAGKEAVQPFKSDFDRGVLKYGQLKEAVSDSLIALTDTFKLRKKEIEFDSDLIKDMVMEMSQKARKIARSTIIEVRELVGIYNPDSY